MAIVLASRAVGAMLSLATAALWALSPLCFASASRRIGSLPVVVLRSILAAVLLIALLPLYVHVAQQSLVIPRPSQSFWLMISSLTGMVIGDILLYESFVRIGPRRSTQLLTLAPVASVIIGWMSLGESLCLQSLLGIALVLAATSYAILVSQTGENGERRDPGGLSIFGIACAVGGAILVGIGAVTARLAFQVAPLDPVLATTLRVAIAACLLGLIPLFSGQTRRTLAHLRDPFVLTRVIPGTLAGPFLGMICYVVALKHLEAGLVSTLVALSPLFILPMIAYRYRVRIGWDLLLATFLAAGGVAMICWR